MTNKERIELAQWAMDIALRQGASETAVVIANQRDIEVSVREKKVEKLAESRQNSLTVNLYVDHKYSSHTTSDLRKEALKPFIEEAVAGTKYLAADEYRQLPDPKYYPKDFSKKLDIRDSNYENIDSRKRIQLAMEIEQAVRAQSDKIITATAAYSDSAVESVRLHSNGLKGEYASTLFTLGAELTVQDDTGGKPDDSFYVFVRHFKDSPSPSEIAQTAVSKALRKIGQKKIQSGKYLTLVENRAAGRLWGTLLQPLSARALQQKSSFLDGMLGKKIASEKVTVKDDPFVPKGLGSRYFDSEGLAAKERYIIEKGILKTYLVDDYYGRKLKLEPNSGSTTNLIFETGSRSPEEMIKGMKEGLVITDFIGGNSNPTTGDFSFGIIGLYIKDGQIVQAVNEMNITGNGKAFWNQLVEMGNDPYPYSSNRRPSMLIEDVQFSGL